MKPNFLLCLTLRRKISEYDSFGKAYKKYLSYTLVEEMWDALITVLIP